MAKDIWENISICPIWRKDWPDILSVFPLALWENGQIWCLDVFQDTESTVVGRVIGRGQLGRGIILISAHTAPSLHLRCRNMCFKCDHQIKRKRFTEDKNILSTDWNERGGRLSCYLLTLHLPCTSWVQIRTKIHRRWNNDDEGYGKGTLS